MKRLFGTDGIRGQARVFPLDEATVVRLGGAISRVLGREDGAGRFLIGRDTRESGVEIATNLASGMTRRGAEVVDAGVLPTAAVAFLSRTHRYSSGVVISASHNPYGDNGIKIFGPDGRKLPDHVEIEIEEELGRTKREAVGAGTARTGDGPAKGPESAQALRDEYLNHLLSISRLLRARGASSAGLGVGAGTSEGVGARKHLKVVLDCANGAASGLAPEMFRRIGADVVAMSDGPDGANINRECGSQHPEALSARVLEEKADFGIAYDGDADRCVLVDETGQLRDGDYLLALFARSMAEQGDLPGKEVVATVMSNIGLERFLDERGIGLLRAPVGDKYVLEEMTRRGAPLGGEQSGHIIFLRHATTGDGLLTSLKAYEIAYAGGEPVSALACAMKRYPQLLRNIRVRERRPIHEIPELAVEIGRVEEALGRQGRCLVRYSGTEPILRIMLEGRSLGEIGAHAERLARIVERELC